MRVTASPENKRILEDSFLDGEDETESEGDVTSSWEARPWYGALPADSCAPGVSTLPGPGTNRGYYLLVDINS